MIRAGVAESVGVGGVRKRKERVLDPLISGYLPATLERFPIGRQTPLSLMKADHAQTSRVAGHSLGLEGGQIWASV